MEFTVVVASMWSKPRSPWCSITFHGSSLLRSESQIPSWEAASFSGYKVLIWMRCQNKNQWGDVIMTYNCITPKSSITFYERYKLDPGSWVSLSELGSFISLKAALWWFYERKFHVAVALNLALDTRDLQSRFMERQATLWMLEGPVVVILWLSVSLAASAYPRKSEVLYRRHVGRHLCTSKLCTSLYWCGPLNTTLKYLRTCL